MVSPVVINYFHIYRTAFCLTNINTSYMLLHIELELHRVPARRTVSAYGWSTAMLRVSRDCTDPIRVHAHCPNSYRWSPSAITACCTDFRCRLNSLPTNPGCSMAPALTSPPRTNGGQGANWTPGGASSRSRAVTR